MNWLSSMIARFFTKQFFARITVFILASVLHVTVRAWDVDLSRRKNDLQKMRGPAAAEAEKKEKEWLQGLFKPADPVTEVVIVQTEKGFVPETVKLRKGHTYKIHILNVNEKEKNTSFVLDAFSEHHGTLFGQMKTFEISPKVDGVFSFLCPETSKQGKLVIFSDPAEADRKPASD